MRVLRIRARKPASRIPEAPWQIIKAQDATGTIGRRLRQGVQFDGRERTITRMHRWAVVALLLLLLPLQLGMLAAPVGSVDVSITNLFSCDWSGSPQTRFPMATTVYFNVSLTNLTLDPKNVTINVSVLDCTNVPIGQDQLNATLPPTATSHYVMSVFIPRWARLGIATAYASVSLEGKLIDTATTQFRIDPPDVVPPSVTLLSPENVTYGFSSVPLVFAVDEKPFWMSYSLNNQGNVTLGGNSTLTDLANDPYCLAVYVSDVSGNIGSAQVHFTVQVIHDVAIVAFACNPLEVFAGQPVNMSITVQNEGTVPETVDVFILVNTVVIDTLTVANLAAGDSTALHYTWNTTGATKGTHVVRSLACPVQGETDVADNISAQRIVSVIARPDIKVAEVALFRTVVGQGYPVHARITVMNQGDRTETCNVSVYVNSQLIQTEAVTMTAGASLIVHCSWITSDIAKGDYTMTAVAWPVPNEVHTDDNALSSSLILVTIPGDVNGDRAVNMFDTVLISTRYNVAAGEPRYDPCCDVDGDGVIDIFDLVIAAGHYGENW